MSFKFKVGDKVRVLGVYRYSPRLKGMVGTITRLGGIATPNKGAVVHNEKLLTGAKEYGEHCYWFPDEELELVVEE